MFVLSLAVKSCFRSLAMAFNDPAPAQSAAGIILLGAILYTGYAIPPPSMIGALKWISWLSPLRYTFEAILTNEFHTLQATCLQMIPSGPGYDDIPSSNKVCSSVGAAPGENFVDGNINAQLMFGYLYDNLWRVCFVSLLLFGDLTLSTESWCSSRICIRVLCNLAGLDRTQFRDHGDKGHHTVQAWC